MHRNSMDSEQFNNKGNRKLRPAKRSDKNDGKDDESSNSIELELNRT